MPSPLKGLSIDFLSLLLDSNMEQSKKTAIRNILTPAMEYIEAGETPPEVIGRAYNVISIIAAPLAIAIHSSIKPEAFNRHVLAMTEHQYKTIQEVLSVLIEGFEKAKAQTPHADHTV